MSDQILNPSILHGPDASQFLGAAVSIIPFSIIAVAIRFWARWHQRQPLRVDDWLTIPALAGNLVIAGLAIWAHQERAMGYLTPQPPKGTLPNDFINKQIQVGKKLSWAVEMTQTFTLTFTKLSFLFFYRRIFHIGHKDAFFWANTGLIVLSILWGVVYFFCYVFVCRGTSLTSLWTDIQTLDEYCVVWPYFSLTFGLTDIIIDVFIFVLPFFGILRLRMSIVKKLATASMFFIGAFAIAAGVVRAYVLTNSAIAARQSYNKTKSGATNNTVTSWVLWACIESTATLVAACLPAVYTPIRDAIKRLRSKVSPHTSAGSEPTLKQRANRWHLSTLSSWTARGKYHESLADDIPMVLATASSRDESDITQAYTQDLSPDSPNHIKVNHTIEQSVVKLRVEE